MAVPNTEGDERRGDQGFTLVEMLVVVLILGVLIAMASGVYLLSQQRAREAAAKTLATHGLEAQKTYLAEKLKYASADELTAADIEPAITFEPLTPDPTIPTTGPGAIVAGKVYIRDASENVVELVARADGGDCFWAKDDNGETTYAKWACDSPPPLGEYSNSWSK